MRPSNHERTLRTFFPFVESYNRDNAPLSGSAFGDAKLIQLKEMTRDKEPSNRDWATFLLTRSDIDTLSVREALTKAAGDQGDYVRAEAICGLARHNPERALPLVQIALLADTVAAPIFEAAEKLAHPSRVDGLRRWAHSSDARHSDQLVLDALAACRVAEAAEHDG